MPRLVLDRLLPRRAGSAVRTNLVDPSRTLSFPDDSELQLVVDVLVGRGYDEEEVARRLNAYQGDLFWAEVFGPAMDEVAQKIGLDPDGPSSG